MIQYNNDTSILHDKLRESNGEYTEHQTNRVTRTLSFLLENNVKIFTFNTITP